MMADLRGQLTGIAENIATLDTLMQGDEEAGDQLFSVLGIHVLAGREEPTHLPNFVFVFYIKTRARLANIESSCWLRQYRQSPDPKPWRFQAPSNPKPTFYAQT